MGMFLGNDITRPVEYFIHVVEYQAQTEGWDDETMIERLMDRIPDSKISPDQCPPSAAWKEAALSGFGGVSLQSWQDIKADIINVFGSKSHYSLDEKSKLLDSVLMA